MNQKIHSSDNQLNRYKVKYKEDLMTCLNSGDWSEGSGCLAKLNVNRLNEFIDLYETKYPEQKEAFLRFFRKTDNSLFSHMARIKCMSYMLDEKIIAKMAELMRKRNGIYIQLFPHANPKAHGASAYFGRDFLGRPRIMYYDIEGKSKLQPPYKTFFHEFGHALDSLMVRGKGFLSDSFLCTGQAEHRELSYDHSTRQLCMNRVKNVYTKTIHEWAAFDVENAIIQTAMDLLQGKVSASSRRRYSIPAIPSQKKYDIVNFVVYHLFLKPDGGEQLANLSGQTYVNEMRDLYNDVAEVMNKTIFASYKNLIVLPKDLFGGITNNQLGGGHGCDYWFKGNRRINEVSREAFAGYFEYRTTIPDPDFQSHLLNPYQCMPNTVSALEAMLNTVLK